MKQKTLGLLIIALLMSVGLLVGIFVAQFIGQLSVPASHKNIIDTMTITASGVLLTPSYLGTGKSTWTLSTLQDNFPMYATYTYSVWLYSYQNDPEVYVCIWGPGKDGKTYQVELAASFARDFEAKIGSVTQDFQLNTIIAVQMP